MSYTQIVQLKRCERVRIMWSTDSSKWRIQRRCSELRGLGGLEYQPLQSRQQRPLSTSPFKVADKGSHTIREEEEDEEEVREDFPTLKSGTCHECRAPADHRYTIHLEHVVSSSPDSAGILRHHCLLIAKFFHFCIHPVIASAHRVEEM